MEPTRPPVAPWEARVGLQLIGLLLALQLFKGVSVLVWTAVMGFSFEQSIEAFALMPGTVEAAVLSVVAGGWVAWVFGRSS